MNKPCAKCQKTVYPVEKLVCLDKIWHKGCFKCEVCGLSLTMKTYKGYNKLPYCNTHYPTTKFTAVADTPENLRLKSQSKNQSQVEYHKAFKDDLNKGNVVDGDNQQSRQEEMANKLSKPAYTSAPQPSQPQRHQEPYNPPPPEPERFQPPPAQAQAPPQLSAGKKRYQALYDYNAADDDETSFQEGDIIADVNVIDDGWMEGLVERTGQRGMLPSNYVEKI